MWQATPAAAAHAAPHPAATYPHHLVETTRLRDATLITIRPIHADDLALERAFVCGLSAQTRYQRLLSGRKLREDELHRLVEIDYCRELALIATTTADDDAAPQQIGVARYAPEADGNSADFAIVIADAWQGHGLGETLLRSLVQAAAGAGVPALTGMALSTNVGMLALARKLGFTLQRDPQDASVTLLHLPLVARNPAPVALLGADVVVQAAPARLRLA